jgi:hypothetical protein
MKSFSSKARAAVRQGKAARSGTSRRGAALTPKKPSPRRGPSPGKAARAPQHRGRGS